MFKVWGDIIYGMNHISQGLSDVMKGGDVRYTITTRYYGSGFVVTFMEFILVHLILVGKCDKLPLRLGS